MDDPIDELIMRADPSPRGAELGHPQFGLALLRLSEDSSITPKDPFRIKSFRSSPSDRVRLRSLGVLAAAVALIAAVLVVGMSTHSSSKPRPVSVASGTASSTTLSSDPATAADQNERNSLTSELSVTGGLFHSVTSVQIKRMTWATLASISPITGTPDVSITPASYVYVTLRTGSFGEVGNPAATDPWYLAVFSATAPYPAIVYTSGVAGDSSVPAWFTTAPDTYAS